MFGIGTKFGDRFIARDEAIVELWGKNAPEKRCVFKWLTEVWNVRHRRKSGRRKIAGVSPCLRCYWHRSVVEFVVKRVG